MSDRPRDTVFSTRHNPLEAFTFDASVAAVFTDMIQRSVPGYDVMTLLTGWLASYYVQPHSFCYDLGCSLGAVTMAMSQSIRQPGCSIIAVDNSQAMLEQFRTQLATCSSPIPVQIVCADIQDVAIAQASVVVLNFTLQFIPPTDRLSILQRIHDGLLPGGVLILSEKLKFNDTHIQTCYTQLHESFKRANGYSELEVSQKRTALENVLVPDTLEQHQNRLKDAGFLHNAPWFQCLNFASLLAWKD